MKIVKFNRANLTDGEIDREVSKVRAFILNKEGKLLVCNYAGVYLLPGGSIDESETKIEALIREVNEEAGLEITKEQANEYLEIQSYEKDYYDRKFRKEY